MHEHISHPLRYRVGEALSLVVAALTGAFLVYERTLPHESYTLTILAGVCFTCALIVFIYLYRSPNLVRAAQIDEVLRMASQLSAVMGEGLDEQSAEAVCKALLPKTNAIAVAITDRQSILAYVGIDKDLNPIDAPIRTQATHDVLNNGTLRVIRSADDIGFPVDRGHINGAIIVPLKRGDETLGTLKFYFPTARSINETQLSIAKGFGELLSTQIAATAMEEQKKLATSMELKALQNQINPHFLFNTINTIASFIRTDPAKARDLLREFAKFYRSTLEDASDLIPLYREIDQTERYLGFEIARFGEDRIQFTREVPDELRDTYVPAFMVQPLVENAVKHAMPATGTLHICVRAEAEGDALVLSIVDDGVGMSEDRRQNIMDPKSHTGLGIAVRNIRDRVKGYYGPESFMAVESEEGKGTTITLHLKDGCTMNAQEMAASIDQKAPSALRN